MLRVWEILEEKATTYDQCILYDDICVQSLTSVCDQFLYLRYIAAANSTAASNVLASDLPNLFPDGVYFDWFGFTFNLLIICQLMASVEGGCNESYISVFFVFNIVNLKLRSI